jgi:hypothetical protein
MVRVVGLGLIQNEHGVWCVHRKVPRRLEEAVARVQCASERDSRGSSGHCEPGMGSERRSSRSRS